MNFLTRSASIAALAAAAFFSTPPAFAQRGLGYGGLGYGGLGYGGYRGGYSGYRSGYGGLGYGGLGYGGLGYGGLGYGGLGYGPGYGGYSAYGGYGYSSAYSGYYPSYGYSSGYASTPAYATQTVAAPYPTGQYYEPGDGYRYPLYYNPATGTYIYYLVSR